MAGIEAELPPVSSYNSADLQALSAELSQGVTTYLKFANAGVAKGARYATDSSAAVDVDSGIPGEIVDALLDSVSHKIVAALDHADTLISLATGASHGKPSSYYAPFSIARSAIEAATLACWLLEPGLDPQIRAARQLSLELQETLSQEKIGAEDLGPALSVLQGEAESLGVARVGKGAQAGFGKGFPSRTDLADAVLDPLAYRLLSAVSHGDTWATLTIGFEPATAQSDTDVHVKGALPVGVYMAPMRWALEALTRCFSFEVAYRGASQLVGLGFLDSKPQVRFESLLPR